MGGLRRLRVIAKWTMCFVVLTIVVGLGSSHSAEAQPGDPPATFRWDNDNQKAGFKACMEVVDWVTHGRQGSSPHTITGGIFNQSDIPGGLSLDAWGTAVDKDYLIGGVHTQEFTYRPKCHTLLPGDYVTRLMNVWPDAFARCMGAVHANGQSQERPKVVPGWYWEVSLAVKDCYLLLPLNAFGLEGTNAWDGWTADQEVAGPDSNSDPKVMEDYGHCKDFIGWRMREGHASFGGTGDLYKGPPAKSVPPRLWHEAINFWGNPVTLSDETLPYNWNPNCEQLLLDNPCNPNSPSLIPELCVGAHATANYDIGFSPFDDEEQEREGGAESISRNLWGASTGFAYFLGKESIHVALWLVDWGYNFDIRRYDPLAMNIGISYERHLLDRDFLALRNLLWFVLIAWAGWTALRGRLAQAGSELLLTVVLLLLAAVLLTHRERYMTETWNLMDTASDALLMAGNDQPSTQPKTRAQLIKETQGEIHRVFVEDTYDHLNWGQSLGDADDPDNPLRECAAARFYILSVGPHSTDPWPRQTMREAGNGKCAAMADFNFNPSGTRLMGAMLMLVSAIAVSILLGLIALTIIVAKFIALLLFAVAPLAALMVIPPGTGRKLAWSWFSSLLQVVMAVIGMSFLMSLMLLTLKQLSELGGDTKVIERFLLMNIFVFVLFATRRSLLTSGQRFASRLSEYLSAPRGNGTTWSQAAIGAGPGLNLRVIDRATAVAIGGPANALRGNIARRTQERRIARRGYKNLVRVAKYKRNVNSENAAWARKWYTNTKRIGRPLPARRMPLP